MDPNWTFIFCWDQELTQLTNGKRLKVHLWPDYKDSDFVKSWEDRVSKFCGGEAWKADFGVDMIDLLGGTSGKTNYLIQSSIQN